MKGVIFTAIIFLLLLVVYFKFIHKKVTDGSGFGFSADEKK